MIGVCWALLLAAMPVDTGRVLDSFDRIEPWSAHPADGVGLTLHADRGRTGGALRLDFAFSGGGYAIARRELPLDLSGNYAFSFWIRGVAAANTLEFKLIDASGDNVWWYTERDRGFRDGWERVTIRRRQIAFAWGPSGGGTPGHVATLELVITAGRGGGRGSVWFDDLRLTQLPESAAEPIAPMVTATREEPDHPASAVLDGDSTTSWRATGLRAQLTVDLGAYREYGGLSLAWEPGRAPTRYLLRDSDDGVTWRVVERRTGGEGLDDHIFLPDHDARYLRLETESRTASTGVGLRELRIEPLAAGASRNAFFAMVARDAARGSYPRYLLGERANWTVVGVEGAPQEALLNEDGAVEAGNGDFSVEPFVFANGQLLTWSDVARSASLEADQWPIPTVRWDHDRIGLDITVLAVGQEDRSSVVVRYVVRNPTQQTLRTKLFLAIRPFQVNPPWQFLGTPGGWSRVDSLRLTPRGVTVNATRMVRTISRGVAFGAVPFSRGDVTDWLRRGALPPTTAARDPFGSASGALAWSLVVPAGGADTVAIEVPLVGRAAVAGSPRVMGDVAAAMQRGMRHWSELLGKSGIELPRSGASISHSISSTLGYILINQDGAAVQPGSRSYERSWIRDGALTSTALLRFGHADVVRRFLLWYAQYQYPNGKVPCCVDHRGADPVAEHDSHGEFIYLIMEYFRHTGDREILEELWPQVNAAIGYLDSLRRSERGPAFMTGEQQLYFGLLPPSISHEGYSAKPMHSYWDDFFALRGFKDAAAMASVLGRAADATRIGAMRDEFATDLYTSIDRVMATRKLSFIPGSADLGDFDATSTTIAISPGEELPRLPRAALDATFERYWTEASSRSDTASRWEAYTPYELRTVGAMLRLGWKARALAMLDAFLADQEPVAWHQWPEVVWHDRHAPKFIGDMPHTWVGSDFLRSAADLFVYEREADSTLVVGQGIAEAWLADSGVSVRKLSTWWGPLSYTVRRDGGQVVVRIEPGLRLPPGGVVLHAPGEGRFRSVTVDGVRSAMQPGGGIALSEVPATVVFEP
ncbi:MAG: discoidin domain-containing protein [Gemmatimonadota bacterium]